MPEVADTGSSEGPVAPLTRQLLLCSDWHGSCCCFGDQTQLSDGALVAGHVQAGALGHHRHPLRFIGEHEPAPPGVIVTRTTSIDAHGDRASLRPTMRQGAAPLASG